MKWKTFFRGGEVGIHCFQDSIVNVEIKRTWRMKISTGTITSFWITHWLWEIFSDQTIRAFVSDSEKDSWRKKTEASLGCSRVTPAKSLRQWKPYRLDMKHGTKWIIKHEAIVQTENLCKRRHSNADRMIYWSRFWLRLPDYMFTNKTFAYSANAVC